MTFWVRAVGYPDRTPFAHLRPVGNVLGHRRRRRDSQVHPGARPCSVPLAPRAPFGPATLVSCRALDWNVSLYFAPRSLVLNP